MRNFLEEYMTLLRGQQGQQGAPGGQPPPNPGQQPPGSPTGQGGPWRDWWQQRPWQDGQVTRPEFQAWRDQRPQGSPFGGNMGGMGGHWGGGQPPSPPGQPPAPGTPGQAGQWQQWVGQRPQGGRQDPGVVAWRALRPQGPTPWGGNRPWGGMGGNRPPRSNPIPPALGGGMGGPQHGRRPAALGQMGGGFGRWGQ